MTESRLKTIPKMLKTDGQTQTDRQTDRQRTHKSVGYGKGNSSITGCNLSMVAKVTRRIAGTQP